MRRSFRRHAVRTAFLGCGLLGITLLVLSAALSRPADAGRSMGVVFVYETLAREPPAARSATLERLRSHFPVTYELVGP